MEESNASKPDSSQDIVAAFTKNLDIETDNPLNFEDKPFETSNNHLIFVYF